MLKELLCLLRFLLQMGTQQELHSFILGCRRDYLDPTRMLEADRDTIDQQVWLEHLSLYRFHRSRDLQNSLLCLLSGTGDSVPKVLFQVMVPQQPAALSAEAFSAMGAQGTLRSRWLLAVCPADKEVSTRD